MSVVELSPRRFLPPATAAFTFCSNTSSTVGVAAPSCLVSAKTVSWHHPSSTVERLRGQLAEQPPVSRGELPPVPVAVFRLDCTHCRASLEEFEEKRTRQTTSLKGNCPCVLPLVVGASWPYCWGRWGTVRQRTNPLARVQIGKIGKAATALVEVKASLGRQDECPLGLPWEATSGSRSCRKSPGRIAHLLARRQARRRNS